MLIGCLFFIDDIIESISASSKVNTCRAVVPEAACLPKYCSI